MWMYDDFGTEHRAQIKEKEEFKKNVLLPITERYLRENKWISDFFDSPNFRDQQDLENKYNGYVSKYQQGVCGLLLKIPCLWCGIRDTGTNNHIFSKTYLKYLTRDDYVKVLELRKEELYKTRLKICWSKIGKKTGSWGFVCESCDNRLFQQVDRGVDLYNARHNNETMQKWCDVQAMRSFLACMSVCYRHNIVFSVNDEKIDGMKRRGIIKTEPKTNSQSGWTDGQKDHDSFVKTDAPFVYSYHLKDIKEKFNRNEPIFTHRRYFIKEKPSVAGTSLILIKRECSRNSFLGLDFYPLSIVEQLGLSSSNGDYPFDSAIFHTFCLINIVPINTDKTMIVFSYLAEHDVNGTITNTKYFLENPFLRDYDSPQEFQEVVSYAFLGHLQHLPFLVFAPDFMTQIKEDEFLNRSRENPFNLFA